MQGNTRAARRALKWVMHFAEQDLARFNDRRWRSFWETELFHFVGEWWPLRDRAHTPAKAEELQRVAADTLAQVADSPQGVLDVHVGDIRGVQFTRWEQGPLIVARADSLLSAFRLRVCTLLVSLPADTLRRCLSCHKIFCVGHGAQRYCTQTCRNREVTRRYRKRKQRAVRGARRRAPASLPSAAP